MLAGAGIVLIAVAAAVFRMTQPASEAAPSLVVRPFEPLTADPEAAALGRALATRMAGGLSNVPTIRVRSGDPAAADLVVEGHVETVEGGGALASARLLRSSGEVLQQSEVRVPKRPATEMQDEILGRVGRHITDRLNAIMHPRRSDTPAAQKAAEITATALNRVNRGDTSEAVFAMYREAMQLSPEDAGIKAYFGNALVAQALNSGVNRLRQRDYLDEAMRVFAEVAAVTPHNQVALYGRCQGLRALADLQAARAACERARAVMPWSARVYKELGYVMLYLGVLDQAEGYFQAAERLERQGTIRWTWSIGAGVTALLKGQPDVALPWLETAAALRPNFGWYPVFGAVAAQRKGDAEAFARWQARHRALPRTASLDEYFESFFPSSITYPAEMRSALDGLKRDMAAAIE